MEKQRASELTRESAERYAGWFRALSDATRVQVLHVVASSGEMSVGAIVDAVSVAQSTVSHHLQILTEAGFVMVKRHGNSNLYRLNDRCIDAFPSAADIVLARRVRAPSTSQET